MSQNIAYVSDFAINPTIRKAPDPLAAAVAHVSEQGFYVPPQGRKVAKLLEDGIINLHDCPYIIAHLLAQLDDCK